MPRLSTAPDTGLLVAPDASPAATPPHVSALNEPDVYAMPATPGQVRFWSLDQLNPGNPALNMPLMWQCTGFLDIPLLTEAFRLCLLRHEVLRTTFELVDGNLAQVIHPELPLPIPLVDLTALSGEALRAESDRLTREHAAFRFDLRDGCPLVLKLLRLAPRHHLLLVTMHHIMCDGISNGILMRDMVAIYDALTHATEPDLPALPIQFADFAVWNEEWRSSPEHEASLAFWRKALGNDFTPIQLAHDPDALEALPPDRARDTGDIETLLIPRDLTARAHAFCVRENVTLNMLLFSIFAALMSRLTGQLDLTIGSPCANRTEDTQDLIGLFMNIQVMRVRLSPRSTFAELLRQVQNWTLGAYENQTLPFEDLVHDPFFSQGTNSFEVPIFFLYQKSFMVTSRVETPAGTLEIVPLRSESPGAAFEIMFAIVDREAEGPRLQLEYNPRFFKATTIQRYLRLFVNLLESAVADKGLPVDRLNILSVAERTELLTRGNDTATDFGPFEPIHTAFLRRAAAAPDAIALQFAGRSQTNRELAAYATAVAQHLLLQGVQPGDRVGLLLGRSPEKLGALLGVLIAGAAYVPLDLRHPETRIEAVLADSGARFVLSDRPVPFPAQAIVLPLAAINLTPQPAPLPPPTTPDSLAYVIYTSGSTGTPKGVAIEHGALFNLLHSMQREPGLTPADILVAVTTLSFDIAALEMLLPLLVGARLVIATDDQVRNSSQLLSLLHDSRATVLQATPGAWRSLIDAGWSSAIPLKVLCGGEPLTRDLADMLLERSNNVWNVYGPTETTIWSSATRVTSGTGAPRLGPPIANTAFYILDNHLQPVPMGVTGELCIGGAGLARGYWNAPELTSSSFVPNPYAPGRLYRTGDLARRHDDGSIQLLGRADFQVKVRGFRIELGEIEAALSSHPDVRHAVVVQHVLEPRPGIAGINRLVAYIDAGSKADERKAPALVESVKAHLARALPEYMMPSIIVALPELPRTTSGKIDRHSLPRVVSGADDSGMRLGESSGSSFLEPRDVIERQLTEIWQTTLGIPRISIRASFFSLGVGSLAGLRLITRMNRTYGMDLGLASLISASSIEAIAELIRKRFSPNTTSALVPIQRAGTMPPLFIIHGIGGNVVNFYGLSMRMGSNQPVYGIQSQALISNQPALLDLKDMASHYLAEIRKVQPTGPYRLLGYSFGGTVALEMAHQLHAVGEQVSMLGMLDSKSRDYEQELARNASVQSRVNRRVDRFLGNTGHLTWSSRANYLWDKISTRAIRFTCMAAARFHITHVPAFMSSAYDINYVAAQNYKLRPYEGRLVLFRASEQEHNTGPRDLGWGAIFKGGVEIHDLPGDHERIFLEPNIDVLASSLRECLRQA